ncbi:MULTISPECIES: hypothetical protein [Hymenobacter]|uniref:DUF304 domain-containing protein n=2 Tax=Hymenobacter TaxID=89966 RepID=A0ABS6X070_9BACT|nr:MULTISPECIES: hypothetical protein [Hymenobacter]MBO3271761.1 hypothetical protein [Hymenobacter defluvii]MBW3129231.1 hypothetical protein [Hymenobacter profundi]
MVLEQRSLFSTTQLTLRAHGVHVSKRSVTGDVLLEFEMPYEEVLPVRVEKRRPTLPHRWRTWLFVLGWLVVNALGSSYVRDRLSHNVWLAATGGVLVLGLMLYGWNTWRRYFVLVTARAHVVLSDRWRQRRELHRFADKLEQTTKAYLRHHYADINPLGLIEPQLRRLHWLRELEVITEAEARIGTVRLTGRHSDTIQSMGQELEAPYVN